MMQNYQDAMSICRFYGYPDLFITFTCNPKWPEIDKFMELRGLKPEDRPYAVSKIFQIKLQNMIKFLKQGGLFGRVLAGNYNFFCAAYSYIH